MSTSTTTAVAIHLDFALNHIFADAPHAPIGTAIAVYAFWVLFSQEGQEYYKARSASTMTMSGT